MQIEELEFVVVHSFSEQFFVCVLKFDCVRKRKQARNNHFMEFDKFHFR